MPVPDRWRLSDGSGGPQRCSDRTESGPRLGVPPAKVRVCTVSPFRKWASSSQSGCCASVEPHLTHTLAVRPPTCPLRCLDHLLPEQSCCVGPTVSAGLVRFSTLAQHRTAARGPFPKRAGLCRHALLQEGHQRGPDSSYPNTSAVRPTHRDQPRPVRPGIRG